MAGEARWGQDAAFKPVVGENYQEGLELDDIGQSVAVGDKKKDRVQRSYFIDRDLDKALRRMGLEEEKKLTEVVNELLRLGLKKYL